MPFYLQFGFPEGAKKCMLSAYERMFLDATTTKRQGRRSSRRSKRRTGKTRGCRSKPTSSNEVIDGEHSG